MRKRDGWVERDEGMGRGRIGWGHGSMVEYLHEFDPQHWGRRVCVCVLAWRLGITVNNTVLVSLSIFTSKFDCSLR